MKDTQIAAYNQIRRSIKNGATADFVRLLGADESLFQLDTPFGKWIHMAAAHGKLAIVEWLVSHGMDVNSRGATIEGRPLDEAAANGHADVVRFLIDAGATLNVSDSVRNPLLAAIIGGDSDDHTEVARLLIASGIDTGVRYPNLQNGNAFDFARRYGRTKIAAILSPLSCENRKQPQPNTHSEHAFPVSTAAALRVETDAGAKLLGVSADDDPAKIVAAVDAFVFNWQCGDHPPASVLDAEDAPFRMGAVWGEQFVRAFDWEWKMVTFHEHDDSTAPAVLSPDRSLAVYPIHFIMGCLQDPTVDTTILIAFNMLAASTIDSTTPGSYFNLMDGVHRIIPRIATPNG